MTPMVERTILVTGATDGLGRALAGELAAEGATVLVHGRGAQRGEAARAEVAERATGPAPRLLLGDLASLAEVRRLADEVASGTERLDALVNNAGIGTSLPGDGARLQSADGYELRFAVNYLAGYLLTRRLVPLLTASAPARVVNVSSAGQMPIDFEDPMLVHGYSGVRAYCQSKLAQILFTFDLADELSDAGVSATALHPATYMPTKMVTHAGATPVSELAEGVAATRRLVSEPELDGVTGRYFSGVNEAHADEQAYDPEARRRLRELSDELVVQWT